LIFCCDWLAKARWCGWLPKRNITVNGVGIYKMVLACTSGWNQKVKGSLCEIDMKDNGIMECAKGLVCFIMQMVRNMKENGITIWKKDMLFSQKTMEISFKGITKQIDWWNKRWWKEIFVSSLHNMRKINWVKLYDRIFSEIFK